MKNQEYRMPKVSIRGNQLTLPDELRQVLTTAEDDSLDAEEVVEGILLRRSPSARRKAGLANLREAQSAIRNEAGCLRHRGSYQLLSAPSSVQTGSPTSF